MLHVIDGEQLLKAHAADTRNRVQTGQRQCGNTHGHKCSGNINRNAEHLEEACDTAAEYLERRARCRRTVSCCCSTGNAQCQNSQQAFQHHCAVANLGHVLFILDGLGGRTRGNQTVETGNRTACNGYKQDREHRAELLIGKTGEYRQVHSRMCNNQTDDCACDHADEHEGGHVVARLLEQPHRKDSGEEDINEGDIAPCCLAEDKRAVHADCKGGNDAHNADNGFLPAGQVKLFLDKAEHNREHHKHDGDHACRTVGGCGSSQLGNACVSDSVGVECARNHICECCNNDAAENPRENQEQLAAGFADVLLNQHTHRLALVLNRSVQRAEVGYRAEEYAADQHPQQYRQPAERRSLNCAGYRACARDRGELVTEYRPAVGRHKVLAVIKFNGRRLGFRVDTPFVRQPASVENVRAEQNNSRDQHDYKCVHIFSSLS